MDFADMLNGEQQMFAGASQTDFSQVMNPVPPVVQQAHRPPATPQELEQRMTGWARLAHKFQTDPNLQQALMMTSMSMMQPMAPGQTQMGHLGQAGMIGMNAFNQGEQRQLVQSALKGREERAAAAETRAQDLHPYALRQARETARGTGADARGREIAATVSERTMEDVIRTAGLQRERTALQLKEAYNQAAVDELKRDNEAITELLRRPGISAEMSAKLEKERAQIDALLASAEKDRTQGKTQPTAQQAIEESLRKIYKELPDTDPNKRGRTEAQFVLENYNKEKPGDAIRPIADYVKMKLDAGEKVPPRIMEIYENMISNLGERRAPRPAEGGGTGDPKRVEFVRDASGNLVPKAPGVTAASGATPPPAGAPKPAPASPPPPASAPPAAAPAPDRSVSVEGIGFVKKAEIPAMIEDHYKQQRAAASKGDMEEFKKIGDKIKKLMEANKSPGV